MPTVAMQHRPRAAAPHLARALGALLLLAAGVRPCRAQAAPPGVAAHATAHATARAAAARRDWAAAAAAMEQAMQAAPTNAEYHYWLGKAYAEQARAGSLWARARLARRVLDAWERALALDSTYDAAYQELIPTYAQLPGVLGGSPSRAEALLERWQRMHPYTAGLARVRFDVARNLPQQTVADAEALVRAFPDSARPLAELATAYLRVRRLADTEAALTRTSTSRGPGSGSPTSDDSSTEGGP